MASEIEELRQQIKESAERVRGLMADDALTIFDLRRENIVLRELAEAVSAFDGATQGQDEAIIANVLVCYEAWRELEAKDGELTNHLLGRSSNRLCTDIEKVIRDREEESAKFGGPPDYETAYFQIRLLIRTENERLEAKDGTKKTSH